jgi:hypothetical protein
MEIQTQNGNIVYVIQGTRKGNLLFIIPVEVPISATINTETSNVDKIDQPWWAGLVS